MKIKDEKQKHNHKLTELLKVCIFAILMIAPLLASVSQMIYVTLNKNAKDSYSGTALETKEYTNEYVTNGIYHFYAVGDAENILNTSLIHVEYLDLSSTNTALQDFYLNNKDNIEYFDLLKYGNLFQLRFYDNTQTRLDFNTIRENQYVYMKFKTLDNGYFNNPYFYTYVSNNYDKLDKAFYYGVEQMTQSDLFNWTQNTAIYTGVKAMTDNLQIQTPAIAILIVYWFILTIIYIIIDIVLKCFTAITHMIFRAD